MKPFRDSLRGLARGPLGHRNFRLLIACDVTSMVGTAIAGVAVPFAVLRSGGSASDVGYVAAAGLVPTVAFLLFGGVLADRMPRQRVMVAANVVQGLAQVSFALLVLTGNALVWEMMALTAARGCAFGFYMPAAQGLLPQTVDVDQLGSANALRQLGLNGGRIAGAALGGLVVAVVGPGWGLVADASSYAIAAALRAGMRFADLPSVVRTAWSTSFVTAGMPSHRGAGSGPSPPNSRLSMRSTSARSACSAR